MHGSGLSECHQLIYSPLRPTTLCRETTCIELQYRCILRRQLVLSHAHRGGGVLLSRLERSNGCPSKSPIFQAKAAIYCTRANVS